MPTPIKTDQVLLGAVAATFFLYVPIHSGGSSRLFGFAIAAGCLLGAARAIKRYRKDHKLFTRKLVWLNAAVGSWIAAFLAGLGSGGGLEGVEGFGYALVMGSGAAWGFAVIAMEFFQPGSKIKPLESATNLS